MLGGVGWTGRGICGWGDLEITCSQCVRVCLTSTDVLTGGRCSPISGLLLLLLIVTKTTIFFKYFCYLLFMYKNLKIWPTKKLFYSKKQFLLSCKGIPQVVGKDSRQEESIPKKTNIMSLFHLYGVITQRAPKTSALYLNTLLSGSGFPGLHLQSIIYRVLLGRSRCLLICWTWMNWRCERNYVSWTIFQEFS